VKNVNKENSGWPIQRGIAVTLLALYIFYGFCKLIVLHWSSWGKDWDENESITFPPTERSHSLCSAVSAHLSRVVPECCSRASLTLTLTVLWVYHSVHKQRTAHRNVWNSEECVTAAVATWGSYLLSVLELLRWFTVAVCYQGSDTPAQTAVLKCEMEQRQSLEIRGQRKRRLVKAISIHWHFLTSNSALQGIC